VRRVVPALIRELNSAFFGTLAVEAAELIAAPELRSSRVALRDSCDDVSDIDRTIAACSVSVSHATRG
jgi:hypothetical protein